MTMTVSGREQDIPGEIRGLEQDAMTLIVGLLRWLDNGSVGDATKRIALRCVDLTMTAGTEDHSREAIQGFAAHCIPLKICYQSL